METGLARPRTGYPPVVGVVGVAAGVVLVPVLTGAEAVDPAGRSTSVYRVPSAVFTSVTGFPTVSVTVAAPSA
jgi:hypothetical protein